MFTLSRVVLFLQETADVLGLHIQQPLHKQWQGSHCRINIAYSRIAQTI